MNKMKKTNLKVVKIVFILPTNPYLKRTRNDTFVLFIYFFYCQNFEFN